MRSRVEAGRPWKIAASVVLLVPVWCLFVSHYVWGAISGNRATGFVHPDLLYHMANVRTYWEGEHFVGAYSNAFSTDYDSPRIYFQPHTLAMALVWKWTGLEPGVVFLASGVLAAWAASYASVLLYERCVGITDVASKLGLLTFFWGGSLATICTALLVASGRELHAAFNVFDSAGGYWMHTLARNFIFTTEAYYHLLAYGALLAVLQERLWIAWLLATVLAASHPFTGIQYSLILIAYSGVEALVRRERRYFVFAASVVLVALAHVAYYLWFLPSHAEHASLMAQWTLPWTVPAPALLAMYGPALVLAFLRARQLGSISALFDGPERRLLVAWFVTSLGLVKHDLLITPHQPIHFTHGHLWVPLYLFGAPLVVQGFRHLLAQPKRPVAALSVALALGVWCFDDIAWFGEKMLRPQGVFVSPDVMLIAEWLNSHASSDTLIVSDDPGFIDYPLMVYTPLRSWVAHHWNTPFMERRREESAVLLRTGNRPAELAESPTAVILGPSSMTGPWIHALRPREIPLATEQLHLFLLPPRP